MPYSGTLTVGSNGYGVNFPQPVPRLSLSWGVSVTASPANSGDVFVGGTATVMAPAINSNGVAQGPLPIPSGFRVPPGRTINIATTEPMSLWLSALPGDGVSFTGS